MERIIHGKYRNILPAQLCGNYKQRKRIKQYKHNHGYIYCEQSTNTVRDFLNVSSGSVCVIAYLFLYFFNQFIVNVMRTLIAVSLKHCFQISWYLTFFSHFLIVDVKQVLVAAYLVLSSQFLWHLTCVCLLVVIRFTIFAPYLMDCDVVNWWLTYFIFLVDIIDALCAPFLMVCSFADWCLTYFYFFVGATDELLAFRILVCSNKLWHLKSRPPSKNDEPICHHSSKNEPQIDFDSISTFVESPVTTQTYVLDLLPSATGYDLIHALNEKYGTIFSSKCCSLQYVSTGKVSASIFRMDMTLNDILSQSQKELFFNLLLSLNGGVSFAGRQLMPRGIVRNNPICYLNSVIQMLKLANWPRELELHANSERGDALALLGKLMHQTTFSNPMPIPASVANEAAKEVIRCFNSPKIKAREDWNALSAEEKKKIAKPSEPLWRLHSEQDAQEFLQYFLDILSPLHPAETIHICNATWLNIKALKKFVSETFGYQMVERMVCDSTNLHHDNEPLNRLMISIDLPSNGERIQLQQAVDAQFVTEVVSDVDCDHCPNKHALKKTPTITSAGKLIFIHIKRFEHHFEHPSLNSNAEQKEEPLVVVDKLKNAVHFIEPLVLKVNDNYKAYQIIASVNHVGSTPHGGHYTADIYQNNKIWHCDDSTIKETRNFDKKAAYILMLEELSSITAQPYINKYLSKRKQSPSESASKNKKRNMQQMNDDNIRELSVSVSEIELDLPPKKKRKISKYEDKNAKKRAASSITISKNSMPPQKKRKVIQTVEQMYKCPHRNCRYKSDTDHGLQIHIGKMHKKNIFELTHWHQKMKKSERPSGFTNKLCKAVKDYWKRNNEQMQPNEFVEILDQLISREKNSIRLPSKSDIQALRSSNIAVHLVGKTVKEPFINFCLEKHAQLEPIDDQITAAFKNKKPLLHEMKVVKQKMDEFHELHQKIKLEQCTICKERWIKSQVHKKGQNICQKCATEAVKMKKKGNGVHIWSDENLMYPGPYEPWMLQLTHLEEQLVATVKTVQSVVDVYGGSKRYRGHCVNFLQHTEEFVTELPRLPKDVGTLIVMPPNSPLPKEHFEVNRARVERWCRHAKSVPLPGWENITINQDNINMLPENGIPKEIIEIIDCKKAHYEEPLLNDKGEDPDKELPEQFTISGVSLPTKQKTENQRKKEMMSWPSADRDPLKKFTTPGILARRFPKLFPWGKGDPTLKMRRKEPIKRFIDAVRHLLKVAVKMDDGTWYYPFECTPKTSILNQIWYVFSQKPPR